MTTTMAAASAPAMMGTLSKYARYWVLASAFLAWFFAGVQMSITPLVSNSVTTDLLGKVEEGKS